jgi:hypothetical protein
MEGFEVDSSKPSLKLICSLNALQICCHVGPKTVIESNLLYVVKNVIVSESCSNMYHSSENCCYIQEKLFLEKLNESHESSLRRLSDTHREKMALMERQFLQQKQQVRYIKSCI